MSRRNQRLVRAMADALQRQMLHRDRERLRSRDPVKWCVERLDLSAAPGLSVHCGGFPGDFDRRVCFELHTPAALVPAADDVPEGQPFDPWLAIQRYVLRPASTLARGFTVSQSAAWRYEQYCVDQLVTWSRELSPGVKARKHPEDPT